MKIISYKKHITNSATKVLALPIDKKGQFIGTELATLADGLTYVSIPATTTLPTQPQEISNTVTEGVALTAAQVTEIKSVSPHVRLINDRVCDKIREQYSLDDELKLARISIGNLQKTYTASASEIQAISDYHAAVEAARAWGRKEKLALGIVA